MATARQIVSAAALVLLGVLLYANTADGIECFVCNSNFDEGCQKDPERRFLKNCTDFVAGRKADKCRKINQYIDFDQANMKANERVVRACGSIETERDSYYRAGFGGRMLVLTCNENGCNSASSIVFSAATFVPLLLISLAKLF